MLVIIFLIVVTGCIALIGANFTTTKVSLRKTAKPYEKSIQFGNPYRRCEYEPSGKVSLREELNSIKKRENNKPINSLDNRILLLTTSIMVLALLNKNKT